MSAAIPASPAEPPRPLLSVSGLAVRFGPLRALDGVDLEIRRGEVVALAGENGAGKTTLVRCVAGDIRPSSGEIMLDGKPVPRDPLAVARLGVAVVWQDLSLCDNLDVASNLLLGRERRRQLASDIRFHAAAASMLSDHRIPLTDTARAVRSLSGGQRQLVAVARAMSRGPRLLLLDEPTASLGVSESAQVEGLISRLRERGTTILLACHDVEQMFRLADRIVVLRHGRVVADVVPDQVHPDDVVTLVAGQQVESSARRQLTRLHGLADRLVSAEPSSSLSLILSALGTALGSERLCIHLLAPGGQPPGDPPYGGLAQLPMPPAPPGPGAEGYLSPELVCAASFGVPTPVLAAWSRLPSGAGGGPVGLAATTQRPVIEDSIQAGTGSWAVFGDLARTANIASSWSVPVLGPGGLLGVITVFRAGSGKPQSDDLDLAALYAGYAASAIERDRLLDQLTARNRLLETIRDVLQTLAGPVPVAEALHIVLHTLRSGLDADEVALVTAAPEGTPAVRAYSGGAYMPPETLWAALAALERGAPEGVAMVGEGRGLTVTFAAPDGQTVLLASWRDGMSPDDATDLMEDAAHSLRMALEREKALAARQEAMTLRQSQELQRAFLRRLGHELRTPLTAITGYATSLLSKDVTWDAESQHRFLSRISAESARLGRLVNDLLDFSAIESGIFRLQSDWCDIPLVLDAAVACLPQASGPQVEVKCALGLPAIWADHDRLEQVFVNLLTNALGHNPPGTRVLVMAEATEPGMVTVKVADDGEGMPSELVGAPAWEARLPGARPHGSSGSGAGLGLSIASGIVAAHGGRMELEQAPRGTCFVITLPVEDQQSRGKGQDTID